MESDSLLRVTGRAVIVAVSMLAFIALLLAGLDWLGRPGGHGAFGREVFVVTSGSMEPAIRTGDMVVVDSRSADRGMHRPGDVITFRRGATEPNGMSYVTHRVMVSRTAADGSLSYVTKGDSNPGPDIAAVRPADVVGRVEFVLPRAGFLVNGLGRMRTVLPVALAGLLAEAALALLPRRVATRTPGRRITE